MLPKEKMERSFTRLDGLKEGKINDSTKKDTRGNGRHATKESSNENETDLTVMPMHSFSSGEDKDLEIIALYPESRQQLEDETIVESFLDDGKSHSLYKVIGSRVYICQASRLCPYKVFLCRAEIFLEILRFCMTCSTHSVTHHCSYG